MWWHTVTHESGKWRGNWRMEWVASTLHTTSEHGVSSITTADAHTSAASSRPNWRPRRFKWTRPFRWKTKSGFCACVITFQTPSTFLYFWLEINHNIAEVFCQWVQFRLWLDHSCTKECGDVQNSTVSNVGLLGPAWCRLFTVILLHFLFYMFRM